MAKTRASTGYRYVKDQPDRVLINIEFKDTAGENVGRSECFIFEKQDWESIDDITMDRFFEKYHVTYYNLPAFAVHSVDYILGIYLNDDNS